jgi:hypothetical protein
MTGKRLICLAIHKYARESIPTVAGAARAAPNMRLTATAPNMRLTNAGPQPRPPDGSTS